MALTWTQWVTLSIRKNEPFVSHLHMETRRTGGWQYKFSTLPEVLVRSIAFVLGPGVSEMLSADLRNQVLKAPSIATLSRARLKLSQFATVFFSLLKFPFLRWCFLFVRLFSSLLRLTLPFSVRLFPSPLALSVLRSTLLFSVWPFPSPLDSSLLPQILLFFVKVVSSSWDSSLLR